MENLYKLSSYDYYLPKELIAQNLHYPQDECNMLYFDWNNIQDLIFKDIRNLISSNDLLFFNNSKVIKARLKWNIINENFFVLDDSWNHEIFFLKQFENNIFSALVKPWKKFKKWRKIKLQTDWKEYVLEILDYTKDGRLIKLHGNENILVVLEKFGIMPLPPYIEYKKEKEIFYQAITAKKAGSVAAPTASLHFTNDLLNNLRDDWVTFLYSTLHIGEWTFKNVDTQDIKNYDIHSETVEVPLSIFDEIAKMKEQWKNIIWVWTTSTRILESLPYVYFQIKNNFKNYNLDKVFLKLDQKNNFIDWKVVVKNWFVYFDTKLFIYPGFEFKIIDKLITNFHLPKSSLLMLVSAFMWYENMKNVYKHAISNSYKFFSFWDAMFIDVKII